MSLFSLLLVIGIVVVLLCGIGILLFRHFALPADKGAQGEQIVANVLQQKLNKKCYYIIHDVLLPTKNGTTQIDHIVLSTHGIFVIETKNMSGMIYGHQNQTQWTQAFAEKKYQFLNPLYQNQIHCRTLCKALGIQSKDCFSLVVFIGDATLKTPLPANVLQGTDALIRAIRRHRQTHFTAVQVKQLYQRINKIKLPNTRATKKAHIEYVQKRAAQSQ